MKKIKKISVRLSEQDYNILKSDYFSLKQCPEWTKMIYKQPVETFSDYIRLVIQKGLNE